MNQLSLGAEISIFLISSIISLYVFAVLLRLLLGFARADFHNPLSQFVVKATNPVLAPMRRLIPAIGKIDSSAVLLAYGLTLLKNIFISLIGYGAMNLPQLLFSSLGDLLIGIIWLYIIFLFIGIIFSWIGNAAVNPIYSLINSLTNPILRPIRRIVPPVGMMDFSSLIAILLMNVLLIIATRIFG